MIRVCALANRVHGQFHDRYIALEKSLEREEIPFYFFVESGPWRWKRKVEWELELTSRYPEDYFVFIDAFDYLFVGKKEELEQIVRAVPLLFSTDCGSSPWPEAEYKDQYERYRRRISPWCWLNGSGPTGQGKYIAQAAKWGLENVPFREPPETDQTFWTKVYLSGFGELDQLCRLTQALYDPDEPDWVTKHLGHKKGRVVNLLTLSQPQFLHATGLSWPIIPKELIPK